MLKIRITFDKNNPDELNEAIDKLKENFDIIQVSKIYEGRGESRYSNVYIDLNTKYSKRVRIYLVSCTN